VTFDAVTRSLSDLVAASSLEQLSYQLPGLTNPNNAQNLASPQGQAGMYDV
jgi:hypothetical protein